MKTTIYTLAATAAAGLALGACGSGTHAKDSAATSTAATTTTRASGLTPSQAAASLAATQKNLRSRQKGSLVLDGFSVGSLSQLAYRDYQNQGGADSVSIENDSAGTAFKNLCTGSVDVVDSASTIDSRDLALCHDDGITPVQLEVGSDAVVLATENETDVGADCLTLPQVDTIFKAGSPIENWDQLGFDDVPLKVAGPQPGNQNFQFFSTDLVATADASLTDFRFDYHPYASPDGIREYVTGNETAGTLASQALPEAEAEVTSLNAILAGQRDIVIGAQAAVKSSVQTNNATQLAIAQAKLAKANAEIRTLRAELATQTAVVRRNQAIENANTAVLGRMGVFQYGYYTLYEQQLRPLEISAKASPEDCVFPSQDTITSGDYPLSRQLLLTVSLQELRSDAGLRAFLLSYLKNSTALANDNTLVPLPNNVLVQEEDWLNGKRIPTSVTGTSPAAEGETSMSGVTGNGAISSAPSSTSSGSSSGGTSAQSGVPTGVH